MSFWSDWYNRLFHPKPKPPVVVVPPKVPPVTTPPVPPVTTPPVKPPVVTPPVVTPTPPVVTPTPPVSTPPVNSGKKVVFSAPFGDTGNWVVGKTSAFPPAVNGIQINPSDNKLDAISPAWAPSAGGQFIATKSALKPPYWNADLVTTEGAPNGFKMKPGDVLDADVVVGSDNGEWLAIWSWGDGAQLGHGEVDFFEHHGDNPDLLELTNHVTTNPNNYKYAAGVVTPGKIFHLKVSVETTGVTYSVDGTTVFVAPGVPANWWGYLIVNISVSAGAYHVAPDAGTDLLQGTVSNLTVSR